LCRKIEELRHIFNTGSTEEIETNSLMGR